MLTFVLRIAAEAMTRPVLDTSQTHVLAEGGGEHAVARLPLPNLPIYQIPVPPTPACPWSANGVDCTTHRRPKGSERELTRASIDRPS